MHAVLICVCVYVTSMALTTFSGERGLMETTKFPLNTPALSHGIFVLYMGTLRFYVIWCKKSMLIRLRMEGWSIQNLFNMPYTNTSSEQRLLKAKRTTDDKGNKVVLPDFLDGLCFLL